MFMNGMYIANLFYLKRIKKGVIYFDNKIIYKSLAIRGKQKNTGYPFVMYYNGKFEIYQYDYFIPVTNK